MMYVTAPDGNQVPLEQLADVEMKIGPNQIQREDAKRRIIVGFNVRGRDVASIVEEVQQRIQQEVKFAPGYYTMYGGTFENLQEAKSRLSIAVPVALLLILVLLYFTFGSLKYGLLIFTAIPLSAIGGVVALWLRGMPFSISAGVGFIALFGVAVLNGIVLIAEFNRLKKDGMSNLKEIVLTGTRIRLRPVIMTATVASLGFIPMALSNGSGAEVQRPLATVVIGGLVTATLLTLLVLPVLYILFEKIGGSGGGKTKAKIPAPTPVPTPVGVSPTGTIIVLLFLLGPLALQAQEPPLTLQQAIDKALQNHPSIQSSRLEIDREKILKNTATDLGKTTVGAQYGQANTVKWDNHFSLTQKIPNPAVFKNQRQLATAKIKSSELNLAVSQSELVYQVKTAWYQLTWLKALQRTLQSQDTMYRNFVKAAELRFKTGETALLEKTTAETQWNENRNQLQKNEADISIALTMLQRLLNTPGAITTAEEPLTKLVLDLPGQDSAYNRHPLSAFLKQQIEVNDKQVGVERAKGGPDFSLGYFNQSIIGFQNPDGVEKYYSGSKRFQGVQAAIDIPLFNKPFANRVKAAKVEKQLAESNYQLFQTTMQGQYQQAVQEYEKEKRNLDYYEKSALPNANLVMKQGLKAFQSGEISYVEYLTALKTGSAIQLDYLQAIRQYNQAVITIQYLSGN